MSRYSSDSDSSGGHRRSRRSRRSSSSSGSNSSHRHRKKSRHHGYSRHKKSSKNYSSRSHRDKRSRSRSKTSSRHSRSLSRDQHRRRSHSRDRNRHKNDKKSRSHSKGHSSKYHSRSSSNDSHSRHSKSPRKSHSSSGSSPKRPPQLSHNVGNNEEQLREKLLKAIKAAESADHQLKQQGVLPRGVKSRNDLSSLTSSKPQGDVIKDINTDEFIPKSFSSSKSRKNEEASAFNQVDNGHTVEPDADSIFHVSFYVDPKLKLDRWVKKLYQLRQKAVFGEPLLS